MLKSIQKTGYKGKVVVCSPGEYSAQKFSKHLYRTVYCSVKLPQGYCLDVDYTGKGWKGKGYKSYSRSISSLKCGFKKIRIRKCGYSGKGEDKGQNKSGICMADWALQMYEYPGYKGEKGCVAAGTRNRPSNFGRYPRSFKIRGGYELILYKNKKVVKVLSNKCSQCQLLL